MGVQALALGKIGDAGGYFAQRFPGFATGWDIIRGPFHIQA